MRTGTRWIISYIAVVTAVAISTGLVTFTTFRPGNMLAEIRHQTVNRSDKAARLSFPDQAYAVARSQKADPPNMTFGMFARADMKAAGYDVVDQVAINWTGPDGLAVRVIDNTMPRTTIHGVEPAEAPETPDDGTIAAPPDEPAVIIPATSVVESPTNVAGEPVPSGARPEPVLDYPQRLVTGAGRWVEYLLGILFGDEPDA